MRPADDWFNDYGESHQNPTNKTIHWICVPLILLTVFGMLWAAPVPAAMASVSSWLNWATVVMVLALVYYFALSPSLGAGMSIVLALFAYILHTLEAAGLPMMTASVSVFVLAWIGQFVGHQIEGKKPSFFKDIQFLMIGPIWLLSFIYRRMGVNY
ncbi:MAG: DUF962 domain-containing protein [Gammaproteobacteria bacterium]|nr:DUF962 domain-containing protein [Gammaproteobacteria bacterium]MCZ6825962.1 DUF962 domain-containing protein [Gammaproteobacteria bacterium]MCZ6880374.1 DUF962 domain-containing protein [Gammaproteobacteria bacterium]